MSSDRIQLRILQSFNFEAPEVSKVCVGDKIILMRPSSAAFGTELPCSHLQNGRIERLARVGRTAGRSQTKIQARNTPKSGYFADADPHGTWQPLQARLCPLFPFLLIFLFLLCRQCLSLSVLTSSFVIVSDHDAQDASTSFYCEKNVLG